MFGLGHLLCWRWGLLGLALPHAVACEQRQSPLSLLTVVRFTLISRLVNLGVTDKVSKKTSGTCTSYMIERSADTHELLTAAR
jgi:hypothetical protein